MQQWQARILSLFNIQTGEGRFVGQLLVYAILLYGANTLAQTAAYALFLTQFNASSLPYAYIGISLALPLLTAVTSHLNRRYPFSHLLLLGHGFLLLTLAAYRFGLEANAATWLLFSLPIYIGVSNSLTGASFASLLGRLFPLQQLQQGKRLLSLLHSSQHIAAMLAGFLAIFFVNWWGTANLFLIATLLMAVAVALLRQIIQHNPAKMAEAEATTAVTITPQQSLTLFTNPYIRLIISLFTLYILGAYFVDNLFYSQLELHYPDDRSLAAFIGTFWGLAGLFSLLTQRFIAGAVHNRFGVRAIILAAPLGLLPLALLFAGLGTIGTTTAVLLSLITLANLYRIILHSLDSASLNVICQPLPSGQRLQTQTVITNLVYPIALGIAGLLLLLFINLFNFTPIMLAYLLLGIGIIWLTIALWLGRAYPQQVQQALHQRLFQGDAQLALDETALAIVRQSLASPHVGVVLYALDTLATSQPEALAQLLPHLLAHPVAEVRQEALRRIEQLRLRTALTAVRQHIPQESDPAVCASALCTLATLDEANMVAEIRPFLSHADAQIRQGALVGLLRNGATAVQAEAKEHLSQLANAPDAASRLLAVQTIYQVGGQDLEPILVALLADEKLMIQREALIAAAKYPNLWPQLMTALTRAETRTAAATALIGAGDTAVPLLQNGFELADDEELLWQIARILGRIGTAKAIAFLGQQLHHPAHAVRWQVCKGLALAHFQIEAEGQTAVQQQIRVEAEQAAIAMQALLDLQKDQRQDEVFLLVSALQRQVDRHRENIFYLLTFIHEAQTIWQVWAILQPTAQASAEQRAYALEALQLLVAKELWPLLLPLVSQRPLAEQLAQLSLVFPQKSRLRVEQLQRFIQGSQSWLQLCALYAVGQFRFSHEMLVRDVLAVALAAADGSLARGTAVWTLAQLPALVVEQIVSASTEAGIIPILQQLNEARQELPSALPVMAKVAVLKRTTLFAEARDETLADVALRLSEGHYVAEQAVFQKGSPGDSMYMIVSGEVRVHDGDHLHNFLAANDVFGEMALLAPEPRAASVTAVAPTHLLRLEQEPFRDLLTSQPTLSWGTIRMLSRHLRARVRDLAELRQQTQPLPALVEAIDDGQEMVALAMPLTAIERIILLKRVELFRHLPNMLLTDLAQLLHEQQAMAGEVIFHKGDAGEALYLIAQGRVRVHDNGHTLNYLQEGEVFGEMALLDPEPRLASVTAVTPTYLLRLEQAPFYQLLEEQTAIADPIIHILSHHLRGRMKDLIALKAEKDANSQ